MKEKGFSIGRNYVKISKEGKKYFKGKHFGIPTYGVIITDAEHINKFTNEPEKFISASIDFSPNAKGEAFTVDDAINALEAQIKRLKEFKNGDNNANQGQSGQISSKGQEKDNKTTKQAIKKDIVSIGDEF
jgi:hypothetical protein